MKRSLRGKTPQIAESVSISERAFISADRDDSAYTQTAVMDKLLLEYPPETLRRSVVKTVPFSAHRCDQAEPVKNGLVLTGAILTTPVRVVNQSLSRTFGYHDLEQ